MFVYTYDFPLFYITDKMFYKINDYDVCRFCAEVLLKSSGKFNLTEFMSVWQQSVPEGKVYIVLSALQ